MPVRFLTYPVFLLLYVWPLAMAATTETTIPADDNIVVTASRTPLSRAEVGSSTTIITREQIERRQARYVTDLLRSVPGFAVSQAGPQGSQTQVRVRGAEANHVLVLIDGHRANDPAGADEFRWEFLATGNVERIEIVRGPQTSLWGSDAVSAVVNVITQAAGTADPALYAYVEGGSLATQNFGVNGHTGGGDWSLGFGFEQLQSDGSNVSRAGNERDGSELRTASVSGRIDASDRLSFDFGLRVVDAYAEIDPIDFLVTGLPVDGDLANDGKRLYARTSGRLESIDGDVQQQVRIHYLETGNRNLVAGIADATTDADRLSIGYQLDLHIAQSTLTLAAEHETTEFRQRGEIVFGDPNQVQQMYVDSAIVDYQYRATDALTWLLSARYDVNSDFDNVLTGRLAASWQLTELTRLYFSAGSGQKAPTFTERFGFFPGQFVGNPELKPEQSKSYEIGVEQWLVGERLNTSLTLFRQDLRDEIDGFVFDPATFLATAKNSPADSLRQGLEFSSYFLVTDRLRLDASYTYTDSTERSQGVAVDEIRRPRHTGSASVSYSFLDSRGSVLVSADYSGTRTDTFFPPFPQPSTNVSLDRFWLMDMTVGIDVSDNVNVFVRAANLLDESYEHVFGFATPGRTAYLGVRASFDL